MEFDIRYLYISLFMFGWQNSECQWEAVGVLCLDLLPVFSFLFFDFELDFFLFISGSVSAAFLNVFIDFHI